MVILCNKPFPIRSEYDTYFAEYPYPLSSFQKHAIVAILENQHVLVTAHTGSGKTLPAEFAIEHWVSQKKKVIYTSPIKALSNQKYYEFSQKYPHISFGLFTGDIKTNPEADVLIMTTEILMNQLFLETNDDSVKSQNKFQMDFQKELALVIFDEVHYINDLDRGHVWEKSILLLPSHVQMVMLSATMDNPEGFAKWIEQNHKKQVHVCSTLQRVVPLSHYSFITMGETELKKIKDKKVVEDLRKQTKSLILLQDSVGRFQLDGYKRLSDVKKQLEKAYIKRPFVLNQLARLLKEKDMLPAIGFVFSRRQVEECAANITIPLLEDDSKIPYTVEKECKQILRKLSNWEEYAQLPEYVQLVSLLQKGIGIHHSGMIPILREMVELCISKKYIKLLFATESFAIGLDCPIKTAIFISLTKFDGNTERPLYSHEYTQMAGRAGRRGIDTIGHVIHCNNLFSLPTATEYQKMLCGNPPTLKSKFKMDYSFLLSVIENASSSTHVDISYMVEFIKKSMFYKELHEQIEGQKKVVEEKEKLLVCDPTPLEVPLDKIQLFLELQNFHTKISFQKMKDLKEEYPLIEKFAESYWISKEFKRQWKVEQSKYESLVTYVERQIIPICGLLEKNGWIEIPYRLTPKGKICSSLKEVHGPIWSTMLEKWNYLSSWDLKSRIGLISCITDVNVKEEYMYPIPRSDNVFLNERVKEMKDMYDWYEDWETQNEIYSGIQYSEAFHFHLMDEAMEWVDCHSEHECKYFIQTKLGFKGISIGDFTKAILKMATLAKEMREIEIGNTQAEWIFQWTQVEGALLKYIATNQSLYV